jgi:dTDP-4-dehydrorhamnose 3,5-epimerase
LSERRVTVTELAIHVDDRGDLFEVLRRDDPEFVEFGQVYMVHSRQPGTVRAWHRHERMWDHFCIVKGAAKFGFVDEETPYYITASDRKPVVLHVPPGVWHGWMALEPSTLLLSIASAPYCGDDHAWEKPDEERVAADAFGACWVVEAK